METDDRNEKYSYVKLKDLESILMLFAPRKQLQQQHHAANGGDTAMIVEDNSLDNYIETFSGVIGLAKLYLKLTKRGCGFFDDFGLRIFCSKTHCGDYKASFVMTLNGGVKIEGNNGKIYLNY